MSQARQARSWRCVATCWILIATPARADRDSAAVRFRADHWLLVEGGRIVGAQDSASG